MAITNNNQTQINYLDKSILKSPYMIYQAVRVNPKSGKLITPSAFAIEICAIFNAE